MFKALRDYFSGAEARPPRRRRARRLVQLFAFEFVVVLLGVLAAQLLQDWYAERKDARRAQAVLAAFAGETRRFVTTAEYRDRAHACEMARLARLAELVRTGGTADEAERATPLMPSPSTTTSCPPSSMRGRRWRTGRRSSTTSSRTTSLCP